MRARDMTLHRSRGRSTTGCVVRRTFLGVGAALMVTGAAVTPARAQSVLDRPALLTVDHLPLVDALRLLQERAAVPLVYSPDLIPNRRVSCACRGRTVGEALQTMLEGTDLAVRPMASRVLIVPAERRGGVRTGVVAGRVVDDETGEPVASVAVHLGTGQGVLTDASGSFALLGVPASAHRLEVTGIGWEPWVREDLVVPAADTVRVEVRLRRGVVPLPEIVVAPGTFGMLAAEPPQAVRTITREEIETMPQLGEDVFRSLTRLAGVAAHDISTRLSVRGSLDREVLVRLDGMELYEPYHLQDWDGVFGVVDLTALRSVELHAGGFGAEYGDRGAGVLDMKSATAVGPTRTTASLNVSHLSLMGQGGFAGDRGSWLVSGREGSLGLLMRLMGADDRLSPRFYDVFGKVSWEPAAGQLLTAHVLHAGDDFRLSLDDWDGISAGPGIEAGRIQTDWSSSYGWLTWDARLAPPLSARTQLWAGRMARFREGYTDDVASIDTPEQIAVRDDRGFRFAGARQELDVELGTDLVLRGGVEVLGAWADYDYFAQTQTPYLAVDGTARLRADTVRVAVDPSGRRVSAFAAARLRAGESLAAEAGVRYDRVSQTDEGHLAPRVQASLALSPRTTLRGSVGRYWQSQGIGDLQVGDGQTLFAPSERSDLVALGLEHRFGPALGVRLEAYARTIADQQPRFVGLEQELRVFPEQQGDRLRIDPGRGRTRGLELFADGSVGRSWQWSASYALAQAEDELVPSPGCAEGPLCVADLWVARSRDQRHAVDLQVDFRPDARWHVGAAWTFHTGWPATPWRYDALARADGTPFFTRTFEAYHSSRLPAYHRLDLRATRAFDVRGGTLEVYADLFNVYDRRNRGSYQYALQYLGDLQVRTVRTDEGEELIPFLPMVGLRYRF